MCFHGAGNARIAASSTIVASTPLHPASIDTAKPLFAELMTLPLACTLPSKRVTSDVEIVASLAVQSSTNHCCAHGVSSRPNSTPSSNRKTTKKRITRQW